MPLIALVTGASQGIGLATARTYAQAGHSVVMAARSAEKLEAMAKEVGGLAVPTDVGDPASVAALYDTIREKYGRIDVVFNNAGTNVPPQDVGDMSFEDWRKVVSVNLDGAFLIASGAVSMMKTQDPQGGRIINNGSISAHTPRPGSAAYTASKHAITGLTKTIALDGRPYSIACGQIDIGNTASDMTARMAKGVPQADGSNRAEPTMDVEYVAQAVLRMGELPLDVNVLSQTIMATNMPFVGRG
jgi:NAD(P)-dependent dehydrogenase (short-subunit alcohol dehydrogenase family)